MIVKKEKFFDYLESVTGDKCYVGLHGIADVSDIQNEFSSMSKEEKARNMLKIGIINARGGSMQNTVYFYGNLSTQNDVNKVHDLNDYTFYSCQSNNNVVVIVAVPILFQKSDGHTFFGGWIDNAPDDYQYITKSISDHIISLRKADPERIEPIIPSEFILGYYSNPRDCADVELILNPRYYYNLSDEERDTFIDDFFKKQYIIDLNQGNYSIDEQIKMCKLPMHLRKITASQIEEYFSPEYQKRIEERKRKEKIIPYTLDEIDSLPIEELDLSRVILDIDIILHSKYAAYLKDILITYSVDVRNKSRNLQEEVGVIACGFTSESIVQMFENKMLQIRSDLNLDIFYSEWYSAHRYQFNDCMLLELANMQEQKKKLLDKPEEGKKISEKVEELQTLVQRDGELDQKLKEAIELEKAYESQNPVKENNSPKDVSTPGE